MDENTGHTFGRSSPRIDGDTDERYLIESVGTHNTDPLLCHLQERVIWLLSFETLARAAGVGELTQDIWMTLGR